MGFKLHVRWKEDGWVEYEVTRNGVQMGRGTVEDVSAAEGARDLIIDSYDA